MPSKKPKPSELREAFKVDLAACWQYARSLHPKETPYAFALVGLEGTPQLYPQVLTEEGLTQVAKRYVEKGHYETVDEARKGLRYSMEDSPYTTELDEKLPAVNSLFEPIAHKLDETEGYALLAKAAMDALSDLDKQGLFGKGKEREKLVLMIDTSFAEKDWSEASVKRLNSRAVAKRFENENKIEGDEASCDDLIFSPDGRSVYFVGRRDVGGGGRVCELVACSIVGLQLKRRWRLTFPRLNGFRGIATDPGGRFVFAIANYSAGGKDKTKIFQVSSSNGKHIKEQTLDGSAQAIATSDNGREILIATGNDTLNFLDQTLNPVRTAQLGSYPFTCVSLKSNEVLVGCEDYLARIGNLPDISTIQFKDGVFRLSVDKAQRTLVVSRYFDVLAFGRKAEAAFGFHVYGLPKLDLIRTIEIPGFQLVCAYISPNGKLIVCSAQEAAMRRDFLFVFETKNFQEIARRPSSHSCESAFSPDSKLLAFSKSGRTTTEPVGLWRIPAK